jgi:lipoprotein-anchoring transpeptidase ErfK/SrfK
LYHKTLWASSPSGANVRRAQRGTQPGHRAQLALARPAALALTVLPVFGACTTKPSPAHQRTAHVDAPVPTARPTASPPTEQPAPPPNPSPHESAYPLYGVVYHYLAQIFEKPTTKAAIIGYMRRGAFFRAKSVPSSGAGCKGSWYEIPGNGFVCSARGFQVGATPQTFDPSPVPPSLGEALPYPYGRTSVDNVPQYYTLPSPEEETAAKQVIEQLRVEEERLLGKATHAPPPTATNPDQQSQADEIEAPTPPGQHESADSTNPQTPSSVTTDAGVGLPPFLRIRMRQGFYISLDRLEVTDDDRKFYRTIRGSYVPADAFTEVTPPSMRGVVLGSTWQLPIAFVYRTGTRVLRRIPETAPLRDQGVIERHTPMVVQQIFDRDGKSFVVGANGSVVRQASVRMAKPAKRPPIVPANAKWIHIQLSEQTLVAYEGDKPVFVTLVSSGEEAHKTPTGIYQIQSKHVSATMDDMSSPETTYSIEDVPWTMYFHGNYALHGAFWHNGFGRVRSHGCVNLSPVDARWLFLWSEPKVPSAWHGIFSNPTHRPGTWVVVEP